MAGPLRSGRTHDRGRTPARHYNLGAIFGPKDKDYGGTPRTAFTDYLSGDLPLVPHDFVLQMDYVEDTARNIYRVMQNGEPGEEYILASEPCSLDERFDNAEELTGIDGPRPDPGRVFRWLGHAMSGVEAVTKPPAGFESELLSFFDSGAVLVDNSKAKRELGIEHRPLQKAVRQYLDWELEQQHMPSFEEIHQ